MASGRRARSAVETYGVRAMWGAAITAHHAAMRQSARGTLATSAQGCTSRASRQERYALSANALTGVGSSGGVDAPPAGRHFPVYAPRSPQRGGRLGGEEMLWLFVLIALLLAVLGGLFVHEFFWVLLIVALIAAYGRVEKTVVR
jgi:hypothetical protein